MNGPWRDPAEETTDLYPGLVVHDGRCAGAITIGQSRLPVNAINTTAIRDGWDEVEAEWSPTERYGFDERQLSDFLYHLLEVRGEFARLLLVLANAERVEASTTYDYLESVGNGSGIVDITPGTETGDNMPGPWWQDPDQRALVAGQLQRCLDVVTDRPHDPDYPDVDPVTGDERETT